MQGMEVACKLPEKGLLHLLGKPLCQLLYL